MRELAIDLRASIQARAAQAARLTTNFSVVMGGCVVLGFILGRLVGGDLLTDAAIASVTGLACFIGSELMAYRESSLRFGQQRNVQEMRLAEQKRMIIALSERDYARAS